MLTPLLLGPLADRRNVPPRLLSGRLDADHLNHCRLHAAAGFAESFTPKAFSTATIVAKDGFPSSPSAL